jgi:hypothetical protein
VVPKTHHRQRCHRKESFWRAVKIRKYTSRHKQCPRNIFPSFFIEAYTNWRFDLKIIKNGFVKRAPALYRGIFLPDHTRSCIITARWTACQEWLKREHSLRMLSQSVFLGPCVTKTFWVAKYFLFCRYDAGSTSHTMHPRKILALLGVRHRNES